MRMANVLHVSHSRWIVHRCSRQGSDVYEDIVIVSLEHHVFLSISTHACKKPQTPFDSFKHESCIIFATYRLNLIMTYALCHHRLQVDNYADLLDEIMLKRDDGIRIMPELYVVPKDKVLCNVQLW